MSRSRSEQVREGIEGAGLSGAPPMSNGGASVYRRALDQLEQEMKDRLQAANIQYTELQTGYADLRSFVLHLCDNGRNLLGIKAEEKANQRVLLQICRNLCSSVADPVKLVEEETFEDIGKCHDWRNHVPDEFAGIWHSGLSVETRLAIWAMAQRAADAEEWD